MKAIVVTDEAAGTAGMTLVERPEPDPAINDVVVQVHASGFTSGELTWPSTWTDRLHRDRLVKEFVDQICRATGGPCTYTGLSMADAHHNMAVTNGEFEAFVQDVVAVLDDFKVGKAEQDELLNILAPLRGEIVEVDSNQTGTPLPSEFTPAPPL